MAHPCAPCFGVIESAYDCHPERSPLSSAEISSAASHSKCAEDSRTTSLDMTRGLLEDRRTLWIVAALIVVLFAIANLPWQLDDYDQAKQAFTSFEMVKEGHWLYQHTPHERVATKPPLVGWISAALFAVTRSWEIAWRLPSLIAALALAFVLFRAAKDAYGKVAAVIAVGAFGLNLLSPRLATLVRTDMPLALVIFLIGLLIWQKVRHEDEWKLRDQVYVFVLLTAAMLIKGPIVYAFLLPGIALFQWRAFKERRLGQRRRELAAARSESRLRAPGPVGGRGLPRSRFF